MKVGVFRGWLAPNLHPTTVRRRRKPACPRRSVAKLSHLLLMGPNRRRIETAVTRPLQFFRIFYKRCNFALARRFISKQSSKIRARVLRLTSMCSHPCGDIGIYVWFPSCRIPTEAGFHPYGSVLNDGFCQRCGNTADGKPVER